jgi:hypothetical protein
MSEDLFTASDYWDSPINEVRERQGLPPLPAPAIDAGAVQELLGSPALTAFLQRRLEQLVKHGHSPAADRAQPLDRLPHQALTRVKDAIDKLGPGGGDLDYALRKIEIAGACLAAAWDAISAAKEGRKS